MIINLAIIAVCIGALGYGASLLVESAARAAKKLNVSDLIIGLTVVAIGTSAPEFAVTISATLAGNSDISVSNVVGSNIFNLGFILGGVVMVKAVATNPKIVYRDGGFLLGVTLLLLFFMWDRTFQVYEGAIFLTLLISYIIFLYTRKEAPEEEIPDEPFTLKDVPLFFVGLGMITAGGHFLVDSAVEVAQDLGVSEWVIGVTIVAAGTSAPEMATSIVGVLKQREAISIGNLIGSDLFNLLGVLGLAGIIQTEPMIIDPGGRSSLILLVGMVTLVLILMRTGWKLSRWEGALLVAINLVRWISDFRPSS